ncbi:hypothetical protein QQF64_031344 [Cirrhinus molitorella]|uniref:TTF-type domain-containing protein n=1 Tax=Cirrhinus molitorella TaxID=172907 RepID=A0ABR3MWR8_9TELE
MVSYQRADEVKRLQDREGETGRSSPELQETDASEEEHRHKGTDASEEMQAGKQEAEPNHANPKLIVVQQLTNRTLRFQEKWYRDFPWLHYSSGVNGILCFYCAQAFGHEKSNLAKNADPAFVKTGFQNWKKATQKFAEHVQSNAHKVAITTHCQKTKPVDVQLSSAKAAQQQES